MDNAYCIWDVPNNKLSDTIKISDIPKIVKELKTLPDTQAVMKEVGDGNLIEVDRDTAIRALLSLYITDTLQWWINNEFDTALDDKTIDKVSSMIVDKIV